MPARKLHGLPGTGPNQTLEEIRPAVTTSPERRPAGGATTTKIAAAARGAARNTALQTATSRDSARPGDAFKQRQRSASIARAAASSGASSSAAADHLARSVSAGAASRAAGARPACGQRAQRLVADRRNAPGSGASTVRDQDAARAPCTASAYDMRVQACARDASHEEEPPHAAADGRFLIFDLRFPILKFNKLDTIMAIFIAVDSPIRSTTRSETPSSDCTRSPDEISMIGFSSKN
ncbi:hypothetical protein F511_15260 [Dorcoceras hygrometricum]|uniref:Uncharacterized protein n=1 Tax=Dorcoceras hygrometricum TaxID=472368 RepID=A0A2Z7D743_9LAMI|nr:hypothetical protein F511_15260 [Dorcoceras hygrometricum]